MSIWRPKAIGGLDQEGRLRRFRAEGGERAAEREATARAVDAEAKLAIARAETETERRERETRSAG